MNGYELTLIFDTNLGEERIDAMVAKVEDKIKAGAGEIEKVEKWGIKKLASMMKKAKRLTQAYYVLIRFKGMPALPGELKAYLKVSEHVLRYYLTRAVEIPPAQERIGGRPLEAVNVGEIKSVEEGKEIGKP